MALSAVFLRFANSSKAKANDGPGRIANGVRRYLMHGLELGLLLVVSGLPGLAHQLAELAEADAWVCRLECLPVGVAEVLRASRALSVQGSRNFRAW